MKRLPTQFYCAIICISTVLMIGLTIDLAKAETKKQTQKQAKTAVNWHKDLDTAHQAALKNNKPIFIVFDASWCTHCRKLENETLSDPKMAHYLNQAFEPVHLDFDEDREIANILKVTSIPCTVVLSAEADLLARKVGFAKVSPYHTMLEKARKLQAVIRHIEYPKGR